VPLLRELGAPRPVPRSIQELFPLLRLWNRLYGPLLARKGQSL
jgi:hypothetical protein